MSPKLITAVLFIGAVVIMFGVFEPAGSSWFPPCAFHEATGMHCPGCGGTRALQALFDGRIGLAVRCNPLLTVGALVLPPLLLWQRRLEARQIFTPKLSWGIALFVIAYFLARNVPTPTTSPLAPPPLDEVKATQNWK